MRMRIVIGAIILVVVFLAGFVPQYAKARRLDSELQQERQRNAGGQLRDLAGLIYVQANQKKYGLAADTSARFFNRVAELAARDQNSRNALQNVIAMRDKVTAELAKGDSAVMADVHEIFVKTRQATQ